MVPVNLEPIPEIPYLSINMETGQLKEDEHMLVVLKILATQLVVLKGVIHRKESN